MHALSTAASCFEVRTARWPYIPRSYLCTVENEKLSFSAHFPMLSTKSCNGTEMNDGPNDNRTSATTNCGHRLVAVLPPEKGETGVAFVEEQDIVGTARFTERVGKTSRTRKFRPPTSFHIHPAALHVHEKQEGQTNGRPAT